MQTVKSIPFSIGKWQQKWIRWKNDVMHLIYPETCLICEAELASKEKYLCSFCDMDLRYTYFESFEGPSSLDKLFWGRVQLESTCALLDFEKNTSTQTILHNIKYRNGQQLAIEMGRRSGGKLLLNPEKYGSIDLLIPIPLHPKKKYVRGYNQSELIAQGISEVLQVPVNTSFLTKGTHTESQTSKGRFVRWDNVAEVFVVDPEKIGGEKHIALVDDVVTTGATLEACMNKISALMPDIRISVLSLATVK